MKLFKFIITFLFVIVSFVETKAIKQDIYTYNRSYSINMNTQTPVLITINGKKYKASEFKNALASWRGTYQAIELRQSYGKKGINVDSDYKKFLEMIEKRYIQSINFNSNGGFDVIYSSKTSERFAPADQYSSDYLSNAIRSNIPLSEYITPTQASSQNIIDWNPQEMIIKTIWGGKFNQTLYNQMTANQRVKDIVETLKKHRHLYLNYFNSKDKSQYIIKGNLPFHSIKEFDKFIHDIGTYDDESFVKKNGEFVLDAYGNKILKDNVHCTWNNDEILEYRYWGSFFTDYVFGE